MGKSSNPTFAGDKEFEKIHLKEKFSYGLGDVACNVVYALTTSLLIYFYTNVVGISAAMSSRHLRSNDRYHHAVLAFLRWYFRRTDRSPG